MVKEGRKIKPGLCDPKAGGLDASAGAKGSSRSPTTRACKEYVGPESKMGGGGNEDMGDAKEAKSSRGAGSK
jgi:hypothetical protein